MKKYRLIYQNSNIEAPEGRFDIGRAAECHLILDDPSVSRVHATIVNEEAGLFLEDRGSRNGCIVNGTRIAGRVPLADGDRITIGHQSIRIIAMDKISDADRTLGLVTCSGCGSWVSSHDARCPQCGAPRAAAGADPKKAARMNLTQQPQLMIATLVQKALDMGRHEEAEKLLSNLMESMVKREKRGEAIDAEELETVTRHTAALCEATRNPAHISRLFAFHHARGRLMSRETIESLYELVRKVGYRSCPEMSRYLELLSSISGTFGPGEKFAHRRLEGLVSLCS